MTVIIILGHVEVEYKWRAGQRCRLLARLCLLPGGAPGHLLLLAALMAPDQVMRLLWSDPDILLINDTHQFPDICQEGAHTQWRSCYAGLDSHSLCSISESWINEDTTSDTQKLDSNLEPGPSWTDHLGLFIWCLQSHDLSLHYRGRYK